MRPVRPLLDRIGSKTQFPDDLSGCWLWLGALSQKRDGQRRPVISSGRRPAKTLNVARAILEIYQGPAPSAAHEAGHTCPTGENERCIAPHHLRWMTRTENEHSKCRD